MNKKNKYHIVRNGRIHYLFWGVFLSVLAIFMLSAFFTEKAQLQDHPWPVYIFAGIVITLWLYFSSYCLVRALESKPRVIIDSNGFSYKGFFKTTFFPINNITKIRYAYDRGSFEWLTIYTKQSDNKIQKTKLDFTGLVPNRISFVNELQSFAPWVKTY